MSPAKNPVTALISLYLYENNKQFQKSFFPILFTRARVHTALLLSAAGRASSTTPATDLAPFGTHQFSFQFDPRGKKWVRFAVWDSAGNGAFTQPVMLR